LFILENKKTRIFPQNFIKPQKAWEELPDSIKCPMTENFSIPANRDFGLLFKIRALLQYEKC